MNSKDEWHGAGLPRIMVEGNDNPNPTNKIVYREEGTKSKREYNEYDDMTMNKPKKLRTVSPNDYPPEYKPHKKTNQK